MLVKIGFLVIVLIVNLIGVDFLSNLSLPILFVVFLPFLIEIVAVPAKGYFDPKALLDYKSLGSIEWALFISVLVWNVDGYDVVGTIIIVGY